jgi:hypothetical protein
MIAALQPRKVSRLHCEVDDWDFDPRYTAGECPICGWRPNAGPAKALPAWRKRLDQVPWDLIGLGMLFVVLVTLGVFVAMAAKINLLPS